MIESARKELELFARTREVLTARTLEIVELWSDLATKGWLKMMRSDDDPEWAVAEITPEGRDALRQMKARSPHPRWTKGDLDADWFLVVGNFGIKVHHTGDRYHFVGFATDDGVDRVFDDLEQAQLAAEEHLRTTLHRAMRELG
jgi:hypothetical protein